MTERKEALTEAELIREYGGSRPTWWRLRQKGCGPRWYRLGTRVYYRRRDIEVWLDQTRPGAPVPVAA